MLNFLTGHKLDCVLVAAVAGTSDLTTASVDLSGYEWAVFFTRLGTAAANNLMHAEASSDDGVADGWSDLTGTATPLAGASDEILALEIVQPEKRYARVVIARGTSSTGGDVYCIRGAGRRLPIDNVVAGTLAGSIVQSPIEGTP